MRELLPSDLDEELIWDLKAQGAKIDIYGGNFLITSKEIH